MERKIKGFKNVRYYDEELGIRVGDIGIQHERLVLAGDMEKAEFLTLPNDLIVVPGFIDEHIHGAGGFDVMDGNDALRVISETIAKEGVTRFLATTMTAPICQIKQALNGIKQAQVQKIGVLGVHLEGPFIASAKAGAQDPLWMIAPSLKTFWQMGGNSDIIKLVTLAPELKGASKLISQLSLLGIATNIGHSNATYLETIKAIKHGARGFTHTYNAMRGIHQRDIGVLGAAMLTSDTYVEVIADGYHVSLPALQLLFNNKKASEIILISDSMRGKGMEEGDYELGGQVVRVSNDQARLKDGTLAGSILKINQAMHFLSKNLNIPITTLIDWASINVARHLGIADNYGSIKHGKKADLVVIDADFNVYLTIRDGMVIYDNLTGTFND